MKNYIKLVELYKKYKNKYIGEIRYAVRIINVDLECKDYEFKSEKELDEFVIKINNEVYCMILNIKKSY